MGNEELEKAIIILWSIWQHKNPVLQNEAIPDANAIIRTIERVSISGNESEDFYQEKPIKKPSVRPKSLTSHEEWIPPKDRCWKINVDASKDSKRDCGGIGWILHDSSGSTISLGFKKINKDWPVKTLELKAIQEGLLNLPSLKAMHPDLVFPAIVIESDAAGVVELLNKESVDLIENSLQRKSSNCVVIWEEFPLIFAQDRRMALLMFWRTQRFPLPLIFILLIFLVLLLLQKKSTSVGSPPPCWVIGLLSDVCKSRFVSL